MIRARRTLLAVALAVAVSAPAGTARAAICQPLSVETFEVRATPRASVYAAGDTAVIDVKVTREKAGLPAEGADVFVAIDTGRKDQRVMGMGTPTDASGSSRAKIRLHEDVVEPGPVKLLTYAYKWHGDTRFCGEITEYGYEIQRRAFRIKG